MKHGSIVEKMHRLWYFEQSKCLGGYIGKKVLICASQPETTSARTQSWRATLFREKLWKRRQRLITKFESVLHHVDNSAQRAPTKSFQFIRRDLVSVSFRNSYVVKIVYSCESWNSRFVQMKFVHVPFRGNDPSLPVNSLENSFQINLLSLINVWNSLCLQRYGVFQTFADLPKQPRISFSKRLTYNKISFNYGIRVTRPKFTRSTLFAIHTLEHQLVTGFKQSAKSARKSDKKTLKHELGGHYPFKTTKEIDRVLFTLSLHCSHWDWWSCSQLSWQRTLPSGKRHLFSDLRAQRNWKLQATY